MYIHTVSPVAVELTEQAAAGQSKQALDPSADCINPQQLKAKRGLTGYSEHKTDFIQFHLSSCRDSDSFL